MIWILSLITVFKVIASDSSMNFSVRESYNILSANNGHVHATHHIANIIRNGISGFNQAEIEDLKKFGISTENGKAISSTPQNLDQTFESEHFRFYYTNEGNDAISDIDYILQMADIFENVYKFYIDTLGFSPPAQDPASNDDLYEIFIENLPSFFFGITYTKNTALEAPACASFIKMRNNYLGSQFNEHTEVENIQVTAVHEFFHAIQFSYNCYERFWFMEATAVWSEDELYNSVNVTIVIYLLGFQIQISLLMTKVATCMDPLFFFNILTNTLVGQALLNYAGRNLLEMLAPFKILV